VCSDVANHFPEARVVGTDLADIQPAWIPENVQILVDDANDWWEYTGDFDFVHCRDLEGGIKDWSFVFAGANRALEAGGCLEFSNFSLHLEFFGDPTGSIKTKLPQILSDFRQKTGCSFEITRGDRCSELMRDAGFEIVHNIRRRLALYPMGTELQGSLRCIIVERLKGIYIRLLHLEGVAEADARERVRQLEEGLENEAWAVEL